MTVLDKVREIAILRSMGYRRLDITVIFLFQGFHHRHARLAARRGRRGADDVRHFADPDQGARRSLQRTISSWRGARALSSTRR